jgi:hypothetical protein
MPTAIDAYYLQAIGVALTIIFAFSRHRKMDLFPLVAVIAWLAGVCAIYYKYGSDQVNFYSNDQDIHLRVIEFYIPEEGFDIRNIISLRYLITYPAYVLSKFGLNDILVLKTFQILSLLGIYNKSKNVLLQHVSYIKVWHFMFVASPLMFFFSLLALRDLTLALFTICFVFDKGVQRKGFYAVLIFLLKPHLAIALVFGTFLLFGFKRLKSDLNHVYSMVFVCLAFVFGSFSYSIGTYFKDFFFPGLPEELFSQSKFFQISLNFSGLQFFTLINDKNSVVAESASFLLLARIVLFDTFLIPITFAIVCVFLLRKLRGPAFVILTSFIFYLGLVSQTDFNSTRQNIPFLAAMGIVAVVNIEAAKSSRRRNLLLQP